MRRWRVGWSSIKDDTNPLWLIGDRASTHGIDVFPLRKKMCTQAWLDLFWSAALTRWTLLMGDKWQCKNLFCFSLFSMRPKAGISLKTWKGTAGLPAISRWRTPLLKKIIASMVIYPTPKYYSLWNAACAMTSEPWVWGLDIAWIESMCMGVEYS